MILDKNYSDKIVIDVYLKDGTKFIGMDVPKDYLNDACTRVGFYIEEKLRVYSMSDVKYIEIYQEK